MRNRRHYTADAPGATLEEVGALLGLTRERVRQIEAEALAKLQHRLAIYCGIHEPMDRVRELLAMAIAQSPCRWAWTDRDRGHMPRTCLYCDRPRRRRSATCDQHTSTGAVRSGPRGRAS